MVILQTVSRPNEQGIRFHEGQPTQTRFWTQVIFFFMSISEKANKSV